MRASGRLSGLLAFSFFLGSSIFGQTNPPPSDPLEVVIHQPAHAFESRGALSRHRSSGASAGRLEHDTFGAYELKASFQTSGATQNEGDGTMEELSNGPEWRWTAQMQGASVVRVEEMGTRTERTLTSRFRCGFRKFERRYIGQSSEMPEPRT